MPIEIRELIIRGVTAQDWHAADEDDDDDDDDDDAEEGAQSEVSKQLLREKAAARADQLGEDRAALIQECVRQVVRILQQQKAR
jgi:hypothetical protein